MNDSVDARKLNEEPFKIGNQMYILGNPVIPTQTLEQLVYVLDQLGEGQPIIIINPQAQTVPDFQNKLAQLIQNNRRMQPQNVTTNDKYRFKDLSDQELRDMVRDLCSANPSLDFDNMLDMYQGLRARAQALYQVDLLVAERDKLWSEHCANPDNPAGSERYGELVYQLIPQAQAYYQGICQQLQELDEKSATIKKQPVTLGNHRVEVQDAKTSPTVAATSSVSEHINNTQTTDAIKEELPLDTGLSCATEVSQDIKITGEWLKPRYYKMPLSVAKSIVNSPAYAGLKQQQQDVVFEGVSYKAVEPEFLLALGIPLYQDGIPIVYTEIGTFKRVGNSNQSFLNQSYWFPAPNTEP